MQMIISDNDNSMGIAVIILQWAKKRIKRLVSKSYYKFQPKFTMLPLRLALQII